MNAPINAVEVYNDYELTSGVEPLYEFRVAMLGAMARMREIMDALDQELMRRMKETKTISFEFGLEERRVKVWVGQKTTKRIKDTKPLVELLKQGHELAYKALSGGQSAWKTAQVETLADTLGLDLIEITKEDKLEIKTVPLKVLENKNS